jgi:RNA polymerase sigma-70 factor (ECF subfamily)
MTGSVADGEDVVQDTLARAHYALSELDPIPPLRPWLFRIAHHRAIDHNRRYDRRMRDPLDEAATIDPALDPEDTLARAEALHAAVSRFVDLAPAQRSCVVLKDALHRGRARLRELRTVETPMTRAASPEVVRYAALFNARDWDGVRAMLADDVRVDLVGRVQRAGRAEVEAYFTTYDKVSDWHLVPAYLDGREVLAVFRDPGHARPDYFVELTFAGGSIADIRDFRYVPYIAEEAAFVIV